MAIKSVNRIDEGGSKIVRNRGFNCHLSPEWRQMAIENTVSNDFDPRSSIVKSVFNCGLSGVTTAHARILNPCHAGYLDVLHSSPILIQMPAEIQHYHAFTSRVDTEFTADLDLHGFQKRIMV